MSLEVAEHLPAEYAEKFVQDLTSLSEVVLFSAARPLQGGNGHVNEQYLTYWIALFEKQGYVPCDIIRPYIWEDEKILWWYRNNIIVFVKKGNVNLNNLIGKSSSIYNIILPERYERAANMVREYQNLSERKIVKQAISLSNLIHKLRKRR